jgi:hypothetical protein
VSASTLEIQVAIDGSGLRLVFESGDHRQSLVVDLAEAERMRDGLTGAIERATQLRVFGGRVADA